jgi:hypothetical protein
VRARNIVALAITDIEKITSLFILIIKNFFVRHVIFKRKAILLVNKLYNVSLL